MKKWVFVLAVIALFLSVVGGALIGYINMQVKANVDGESKTETAFLLKMNELG